MVKKPVKPTRFEGIVQVVVDGLVAVSLTPIIPISFVLPATPVKSLSLITHDIDVILAHTR